MMDFEFMLKLAALVVSLIIVILVQYDLSVKKDKRIHELEVAMRDLINKQLGMK